ncbi:type I-B CRISPR-associated protein Cas7/Csh2 [Thermoanaerobacterium thermosaccharolyticum]|uniref:type I-B CRISPR-associated protein Cas7/Csh2 n=1 Tax=Thermoanaerobacterium thermosaccharolyticum TaxID=1517 RepID=UPI001238D490|nr:type I-B CRISPR-associated protein Cas7/Csh2 [Thermoanaerobacterium thermosaccharolyticum]KAA5805911.1 type I-B CRISPR-associated protein Cas7/Csh2 [Thermoanaerobacterium thermosaccharolyticum]MCP2238805.1 CRISPR-associated protein Csh2 [Thermoanaerobacterium thermosaccharolyticum]
MNSTIKNRSEILFLYDVSFANPNGDPVDENKPRIDEETGINIVTDVRLKRTIRDYLAEYKGKDVFILETRDESGKLRTKDDRIRDFGSNEDIINRCIDVRLFGATTAVKDKTMTLTGPVQFGYGRSLHKVNMTYIKGTTVMPSQSGNNQGTFTEKYILPYSLISFYGIVNENAAKNQNIPLTDEDIDLMLEAMWNGTKNLMSNSKMGHMPRFLLQVVMKEKNYQIGELNKRIKFVHDVEDEELRDIKDGKIEIKELVESLNANKDKISAVRYVADERVVFSLNGDVCDIDDVLKGFSVEKLSF